ncbi:hypothetical protein TNCV_4715071 [Trichonephila clavipes]|nr:hypothetical protein TNCV_4715071 [Trichonephila clavipes]
MNSGSYSASELRTQQVSIRSDSQFYGENFCCSDVFKEQKNGLAVGLEFITSNCQFERGRIIGQKEGGRANRRNASYGSK